MTNKEAIEIIKNMNSTHRVQGNFNALVLAVKALEQMDKVKMVTESDIIDYEYNLCPYGSLINFASDHGILIEEPKKEDKNNEFWIRQTGDRTGLWYKCCGDIDSVNKKIYEIKETKE